jgi:hypothetical protein
MGTIPSRLGCYRIVGCDGAECAIVHRDAGDAAPYLPRALYEAMRFEPQFDALPLVARDERPRSSAEGFSADPMLG